MGFTASALRHLTIGAALVAMLGPACNNAGDGGSISVSGNIELTDFRIGFKRPGRLLSVEAQEGDWVKAGQVVARLDDADLLEQRRQAAAAVDAALSRLQEIRTQVRFQERALIDQLAQRRAELDQAQAQLRELELGARDQERKQAKAALERAEAQLRKTEADWQRAQELYKNEDISRAQYDQFQSSYDAAEAAWRESRERLDLVEEGARREDIEAARAAVARSEASLRLTQAQELEISRTRQTAETATADVEQARAGLAQVETLIDEGILRSPADGVVLVRSAEPGEVMAAGSPILQIGDFSRTWIRAYIGEKDLGRVRLGQPARVTTDSFPGREFEGRISFISSEAEFTPKQIQTAEERVKLVYRIKISVPNPDYSLKLNMPCDAEIVAGGESESGAR